MTPVTTTQEGPHGRDGFLSALVLLSLSLAACTAAQGPCPASQPTMGAVCATAIDCEYGGDAHHRCSTMARCGADQAGGLHWSISADPSCVAQNGSQCNPTFAPDAGVGCSPQAGLCDYPEGRCVCEPCRSGAGQWACRRWDDVSSGCPSPAPLIGSPCTQEGAECSYGSCCTVSTGPLVKCVGGVWQDEVDTTCACALSC